MAEVIYGMSDADYHALKRLSASLLKTAHYSRSMAEVRAYMEGVGKTTQAMRESWLAHLLVNCPAEWKERVVVQPASLIEGIETADGKPATRPKATAEYARRLADWNREHHDKIRITPEENEFVEGLSSALRNSCCWERPTATEVTVLFDFNGEPAKCKADAEVLLDDGSYDIYDWKFVKSTRDFDTVCFRYGYHIQAAFYKAGYEAAGRKVRHFFLVGIDKSNPTSDHVVCAPVDEQDMLLGLREAEYWQSAISFCRELNHWPPVTSPTTWSRPKWYESPVDQA